MIVILLTTLLLVSSQVYADLSVADLEKIDTIVKASETRMKEYISQEINQVNTKIEEMDKRLTNQINTLEKQLTIGINAVETRARRNFNLILGLMVLIAFAVGLPQIITASQGRKLQEYSIKLEDLKQEIELLKQERSV